MPSLPPELLTQWLQPGALVAGAVGGLVLLISAFRNLRAELKEEMKELKQETRELKEEMRASEARFNKRIDEVRTEMKEEVRASEERVNRRIDEVKEEMKEIKALLIQALQPSLAAKP
ncbi:MAG: DUF342 domain-containing protein [Synechococcus sp. SB0668_bin_15]|nr:DUF342 domain-containing protein [Synechococcus sp. SB0668_bin_15]MYC50623.1 DUF342 domain-containing protein [Synechococcus sp. SB0662_bin_14]